MFLGERALGHLNAIPRQNTDLQSPTNGLAAFTETARSRSPAGSGLHVFV